MNINTVKGRGASLDSIKPDLSVDPKSEAEIQKKDKAQLYEAAKDFEAIFMQMVLKSMRDTVDKSGFIDGGNAEQIYEGMLDEEYSKALAGQSGLGLADSIVRQLGESAGKSPGDELIGKAKALKAYQALPLQDAAKKVKI